MPDGPQVYRIRGLDCAEEVASLKRELGPRVGGEGNLGFDILNGKLTVAAGVRASPGAVRAAVARAGMRAEPWRDDDNAAPAAGGSWVRNRRAALAAASGGLLVAGAGTHAALSGPRAAFLDEGATAGPPAVVMAFYLLSILAGVWAVLPKAWERSSDFAPT